MNISRRALYAMGEPLGACVTRRKPGGGLLCGGGDGGDTTTQGATTNTENNDKRNAVQDGVAVSGDGNSLVDNSIKNDPDAVKAMAQAGADIIKSSGGAVVDLAKLQTVANTDAWDKTLTTGAGLVDKLIDKVSDGFTLSSKVVDSFTPTETKNAEIGKYAMLAAAAVAAVVLLNGGK